MMNCNSRLTTPCRPVRMPPSSMQSGYGCDNAYGQSTRGRSSKPVVKSTIPKRGPPPSSPKKIDYKNPQMTKAMLQRIKHTQKFQGELDRKDHEKNNPLGERKTRRSSVLTCGEPPRSRERRPTTTESRGRFCVTQSREPLPRTTNESTSRPPTSCMPSCSPTPPPSRCQQAQSSSSRGASATSVPPRTRNLAKSMNADIVQAEPLQRGPVDNLIIPPGTINSERTTIVSIPQPEDCVPMITSTPAPCQPSPNVSPNRNIQALNDTLDEQDAAECAVVNLKLQDLQQARRDFVLAVANVSGNAISLPQENFTNSGPISNVQNNSSNPRLIRCPSINDPYLRVEYGRDHPIVEAARDYLRDRQADRNIEDNFNRVACQPPEEDFAQDYLEGCGMLATGGDDDDYMCIPQGQYTVIPRKSDRYSYEPNEIDRLENFFDLQNYPPSASCPASLPLPGPPPGRECLHPDLWDIEDPWYKEPSVPDLIDWGSDCT